MNNPEFVPMVPPQKKQTLLDRYVQTYIDRASGLPAHLAILATRSDLSPVKRQAMLTSYTSVEPKSIEDYLNQGVQVVGACPYEQGAYEGRDGNTQDGYTCILIKLAEFERARLIIGDTVRYINRQVVIKSSSTGVNDFFLGLMTLDQAFDFKEPLTVFFTGSQGAGYRCQVIEDDLAATMEEMAH